MGRIQKGPIKNIKNIITGKGVIIRLDFRINTLPSPKNCWPYPNSNYLGVMILGSLLPFWCPCSSFTFQSWYYLSFKPVMVFCQTLSHYKRGFTFISLNVSPDHSTICISYTLGQSIKCVLGFKVLTVLDYEWSYPMEQWIIFFDQSDKLWFIMVKPEEAI